MSVTERPPFLDPEPDEEAEAERAAKESRLRERIDAFTAVRPNAPGYYPDGFGRQRWWTGSQWSETYRDIPTTEGDQVADENEVTFEQKVQFRMKRMRQEDEQKRIEDEARRRLNEDAEYKRVSGL